MAKRFARDTLGRFARQTTGRRAKRGLGRRAARGGRQTNAATSGGKIAGLDAARAAKKATSSGEADIQGSSLKKGR